MIGLQDASRRCWISYVDPATLILTPYGFTSECDARSAALKIYGAQYFEYVNVKPYSDQEIALLFPKREIDTPAVAPTESEDDKIEITPAGRQALSRCERHQRKIHAFWMVVGLLGACGIGLALYWSPWQKGFYADPNLSFVSGLLMGLSFVMVLFAIHHAEGALCHIEEADID